MNWNLEKIPYLQWGIHRIPKLYCWKHAFEHHKRQSLRNILQTIFQGCQMIVDVASTIYIYLLKFHYCILLQLLLLCSLFVDFVNALYAVSLLPKDAKVFLVIDVEQVVVAIKMLILLPFLVNFISMAQQ